MRFRTQIFRIRKCFAMRIHNLSVSDSLCPFGPTILKAWVGRTLFLKWDIFEGEETKYAGVFM